MKTAVLFIVFRKMLLDRLQNAQDHIADVLELVGAGGQGDDMAVRRGDAGGGAEGGMVHHLLQELLGQLELIDAAVGIGHLTVAVEDIARGVHDDSGKQMQLSLIHI